jgi:WD40 repeat protein
MIDPLNPEVAILNAALELPAGQRAAYLDHACANDASLRQQVEGLLQAHEQAPDFLGSPPAGLALKRSELVDLPPTEKPGDKIGRYKLLQQIGEGGCGVVYMAEQEEPVRRRVAFKVIKLGMDTKQVIVRFEAERQALALMDHPNIAKVLDAGATETGRPYFVMELVRGIKITDFCDENKLSTEERLKLFIQVCQAIQHAHQKGIIHRDIKPSNILVTVNDGVPVPKVIDFGIAKATQGRLTDQTLFTAFEQFIGTPAYMSPEQAVMTSLDIDTRSDIYSLGVLLYELLTGRTPFDQTELLAAGLDEMRRTIREKEPPRPSTRLSTLAADALTTTAKHRHTDAPKLIHLLRGDLDWIVMKAMDKDRSRRYETANGLARDIQRHLNNEPVNARPPSAAYRFERLVRRNRLTFAAISGVAAALLVGLGGVLWQWRRAEQHARGELKHRLAAEESSAVTRLNRYAADISVAAQAVERGDYGLARRTLAALRPQPGEQDLRGFEWRYLWSHCQGDQLATLTGHEWIVTCAAFSRDGKLFATGSQDATTRVWDTRRRQLITVLRSTNEAIWSVAFAPDGELLMTAGSKGSTKFWNTSTWSVVTNFPGRIAVLSKVGSVVAVADSSPFWWEAAGNVTLWDYRTGKQLTRFDRPGRSLALSSDGQILAVAGKATGIELWDVPSGKVRQTLATEKPVWSLNFSPDGQRLAAAGWSSDVWVWDLAGDPPPEKLKGHQLTVWSATFSPDSSIIATTGSDQTIRLWDAVTLQLKSILRGHGGEVWCAAFSPDAELLVSGGKDQNVMLWSAKSHGSRESLPNQKDTRPIFSADGSQVIVAIPSGAAPRFALWDASRRVQIAEIPAGFPCGFSFDRRRVAMLSIGQDALKLWSATDQTEKVVPLANAPSGNKPFRRFGFSPGRETFFAIDRDGQVFLWEAGTGKFLGVFQGPAPPIRNAVLGPGGKHMAISVERENVVRFYERAASRETRLAGHRDFVSGLAFSPDGTLLASGSVDGTIRLWSATNCEPRGVLFGHMQEATDVDFSNDGHTLASVGFGESVRLWHLPTCRELISLDLPRAGKFLQFSHDGKYLAVTTSDNAVELLDAPPLKDPLDFAPRLGQ